MIELFATLAGLASCFGVGLLYEVASQAAESRGGRFYWEVDVLAQRSDVYLGAANDSTYGPEDGGC